MQVENTEKKLKILYLSDFSLAKTGFGRTSRCLLSYLYRTGKYEIVNLCCGMQENNPAFSKTPWKSIGTLPANPQEMEQLNRDPNAVRVAGYGAFCIDKIIQQERPDIFIGVQDFWGVEFCIDKPWFNKITSVVWTTLDSLPLFPAAVEKASKIKNYWVWSNFAEHELKRLGNEQVKTVHGPLETKEFYRLKNEERAELRRRLNIPQDAFIIGDVFRNQLRKSVPNLLEGYSIFKKNNPKAKTRLLLHTCLSEGWDIPRLAAEYSVDTKEILVTYVCRRCRKYQVKSFDDRTNKKDKIKLEEKPCPHCNEPHGQITAGVGFGVTEAELNEIYNLMDVMVHSITSGGQEIPVQEAKLAEVITLVTNYSCGEELCEEGSGSFPLDWAEYREFGTQFRKASTIPSSIAKQLNKVYEMDAAKRLKIGKQGRDWALKNFSIEEVGKSIDEFLSQCPKTNYDFSMKSEAKNPNAQIPDIQDNEAWITALYKEILKCDVPPSDDGHLHWQKKLKDGMPRAEIENYFRGVAAQDEAKNNSVEFGDILDKNDKKRVLLILPESIGDVYLATSLFESVRARYPKPEWTFYFATKPEYFEILDGNPYVDKVIPYIPQMDNLIWCEGQGKHKGFFDVAYPLHFGTQRLLNYLHNGIDIHDLNLK